MKQQLLASAKRTRERGGTFGVKSVREAREGINQRSPKLRADHQEVKKTQD